jgi:NAD(P)-dependent dehydrogenase (short-subunit alcohol dehydrogenase family)
VKLAGQVALVTGGSRGLGLATLRALGREGASLACLARDQGELDRATAALAAEGRDVLGVRADVTSEREVGTAVEQVLAKWNRLDVVVLNAGTWQGSPIQDTTEAAWDLLIDLNLKGAFLTLKAVVPALMRQRRGLVIGIGSLGAWVGQRGSAAYAASKWGLRGLLESAALELKPHGVRVSLVHPHNMNTAGPPTAAEAPERLAKLDPEDVASLVAWIAAAPEHVAVGNVTIWPQSAGIKSF